MRIFCCGVRFPAAEQAARAVAVAGAAVVTWSRPEAVLSLRTAAGRDPEVRRNGPASIAPADPVTRRHPARLYAVLERRCCARRQELPARGITPGELAQGRQGGHGSLFPWPEDESEAIKRAARLAVEAGCAAIGAARGSCCAQPPRVRRLQAEEGERVTASQCGFRQW